MIRRRREPKTGPRIDYSQLALSKTPAVVVEEPDEAAQQRQVRRDIEQSQGTRCLADGVSPVCAGRWVDPHHLVRRSDKHQKTDGGPGKHDRDVQVGLCRPCHTEADYPIGGRKLLFSWPGKWPRASVKGNVTPAWVGRSGRR